MFNKVYNSCAQTCKIQFFATVIKNLLYNLANFKFLEILFILFYFTLHYNFITIFVWHITVYNFFYFF